ncbi:MAG: glutathione binding-like protein [Sulfitobacter sp.]
MPQTKPYDVFVFHRSYFCGKFLGYLRYKEIPHNAIYKSRDEIGDELMRNTGLRQMPVVKTAEGLWLQDTTPMIDWFEARHAHPPVTTGDPVTDFFVRLMEDYADEWMWRPAILSRWESHLDHDYYRTMFVNEFIGGVWAKARPLKWIAGKLVQKHQTDKYLEGDGITRANRDYVWSIYTDTLDRLEAIFQTQPYLLGDKPCLADFGFFGSMFWHFGNDPTPNRIMQDRAPGVYEWVARMWNMTANKATGRDFNFEPGAAPRLWGPLLADACSGYLPYLHANAKALEAGKMRFDHQMQGHDFSGVHVSPYRVWCRERLLGFLNAMPAEDQNKVRAVLEPLGGWEPLTQDAHIRSDYDPEGILPLCKPAELTLKYRLLAQFTGSNHVGSRRHNVKL